MEFNAQPQTAIAHATYPAKVCCIMVGLPARGKTYIARKIVRYFDWLGYPTKIFNVGNYRRDAVGAKQFNSFFDPTNPECAKLRMEVAMLALDDMIAWFKEEERKLNETVREKTIAAEMAGQQFTTGNVRAGGSGFVTVYDATNTTKNRRKVLYDICVKNGVQVLFVESICDDIDVVMSNIREVKISSPDYIGVSSDHAVQDFMKRIEQYEKVYETLDVDELVPFIKLTSIGKQVQINMVRGYIPSRIVYLLMNLNITPRHIYFSRHGESEFNRLGKIGGDSNLSPAGWKYAQLLPLAFQAISTDSKIASTPLTSPLLEHEHTEIIRNEIIVNKVLSVAGMGAIPAIRTSSDVTHDSPKAKGRQAVPPVDLSLTHPKTFTDMHIDSPLTHCIPTTPVCNEPEKVTVWTSSLKRTLQTSGFLVNAATKMQWTQLNELDSGFYDGLTYDEIEHQHGHAINDRDNDKYNYRYPGGESYKDLVQRLEPVIFELERHNEAGHAIFIIGHQAVLRCIYAYFLNLSHEELPYIEIPLHTIFKITPKAYETQIESFKIDIPAANTHRMRQVSRPGTPNLFISRGSQDDNSV